MEQVKYYAYVLISTHKKPHHELEEDIKSTADVEVVEIHSIFSRWDAIVKLQSKDYNAIGRYVVDVIRKAPGIVNTITLAGDPSLERKLKLASQSANFSGPQQAPAQQSQ